VLDLSEADAATLSVWAVGQDPSYASEVFALYAGTSADPASMTKIAGDFTATGSYVNYTADLSAFAGEEAVYVAIRHYNVSDMFILNVDDVEILVTAAEDGDALKNVPAKTYEAVPMNYTRKPLADGTGVASIAAAADVSGVAELSRFGEQTQAVGGTNAIKAGLSMSELRKPIDETTVGEGAVQIVLSDDKATTNGLFTVTYNADELTFVDATSALELNSIVHEIHEPAEGEDPALRTGTITFAFAAAEEIPAETVLSTLKFSFEGEVDTTVVVVAQERNDDVAVEEDPLVIEIKAGGEEPPVDEEIFELTTELKDGDKVVIYNPAAGKAMSNEAVSTNYRAGKAITPEDGKVINPAADLVWNVTVVEGGIELTDAEGHKLSIQEGKNNLPLDAEETVWEIQKGEGNTVFIVSTTAVGSSGDHKAVEYYSKYDEFSAFYLNTTDDQFIMELYAQTEGGEEPPEEHNCPCYMFEDMPEYGTIEHAAIDWAYTHDPQITDGMTDTSFGTDLTVTRAQAVTFLWRADGKPEVTGTTPFTDLEADWYKTPVLWAYTHDPQITDGMTDTTFEPETTLNRAMMITFLYRQQGAPAYTGEDYFADTDCPSWFEDAMNWAVANGIITADTVWNENCPRVDVVVYLFRVLEPAAAAEFD
jgi:hypothetical protein